MKTIIHVPSGEFRSKNGGVECGPFEPSLPVLSVSPEGVTTYDPDYAIVVVPRMPDPRTEKWNGSAIVAKTQAEIDAYDAMRLSDTADKKSLKPDTLAMVALIVRNRNIGAWTAMTPAQRKQAVRTEAVIYKSMREFFDKGVD